MKEENISLIGVVENGKGYVTFNIIKNIFMESGFSLIHENKNGNIAFLSSCENIYIGIINISFENLKHLSSLEINFDIVVCTNIGYKILLRKEEKLFFTYLNGIIILNIDNENNIELLEGNDKALVITYGLNNKATVNASSLDINNSIRFNFCLQREIKTLYKDTIEPLEFPVEINLFGKEYIYSALAAISVALCYGLNIDDIRYGVLNVEGSYRKMEKIHEDDFIAIDNFCMNPEDYSSVFETIQHLKYKNIVLLNGIEIDQGIHTIKENLEIVLNWIPILGIKKVIFYIDKKDRLIEENIKYLFTEKRFPFNIYYNLKECIQTGLNLIEKDDMFLFLGSDILKDSKHILVDEIEK